MPHSKLLSKSIWILVLACIPLLILKLTQKYWNDPFIKLDLSQTEQIKEVLLGTEPWVLLCEKKLNGAKESHKKALIRFKNQAHLGLINCTEPLPSGYNVLLRFNLPLNSVGLLTGNQKKPIHLNETILESEDKLINTFKKFYRPRIFNVKNQSDFSKHCNSGKNRCIIFPRKQSMEVLRDGIQMQALADTSKDIVPVSYDALTLGLNLIGKHLEKKLLIKDSNYQAICIVYKSPGRKIHTTDSLKHFVAFFEGELSDTDALKRFLNLCAASEIDDMFIQLSQTPRLRSISSDSQETTNKTVTKKKVNPEPSEEADQYEWESENVEDEDILMV